MKIDELIEWLESSLERKETVPDMDCYNGYRKTLKAFEIALATLKKERSERKRHQDGASSEIILDAIKEYEKGVVDLDKILDGLE